MKDWMQRRREILDTFQSLIKLKSDDEQSWQTAAMVLEEELKMEDYENTRLIASQLLSGFKSCFKQQGNYLRLLDKLLTGAPILRPLIFEILDPCLTEWISKDGKSESMKDMFLKRFIRQKRRTSPPMEPTCETSPSCVDVGTLEEDIHLVMKQLKECLALVFPRVEDMLIANTACHEEQNETLFTLYANKTENLSVEITRDISAMETEENKVVFDTCRELVLQLEKCRERLQSKDVNRTLFTELESLLSHCYHLGLRPGNTKTTEFSSLEDNDIQWEAVDVANDDHINYQETCSDEEHSYTYKTLERLCNQTKPESSSINQLNYELESVSSTQNNSNEDLLQQLETIVPYDCSTTKETRSRRKQEQSIKHKVTTKQVSNRNRKRQSSARQRIVKQLKSSSSKVSRIWNGIQDREELERYHQTFANSVTVGRID